CDGVLNDSNGQHSSVENALQASDSATGGAIAEGNVGGGTGMICYDFKGGTGTSSRRVRIGAASYTLGALVQANHGMRDWLTILGGPVGRRLQRGRSLGRATGPINDA